MTVLTIGTFDLFHIGHANLIRRAASYGDRLVVGVNSDRFVEQYKGERPVILEAERLEVVAHCKGVSEALLNDGPGRALIEQVMPSLIAVGSDWHDRRDYLAQIDVTQGWLDANDVAVLYLPRTPGVSSSAIRNRIP